MSRQIMDLMRQKSFGFFKKCFKSKQKFSISLTFSLFSETNTNEIPPYEAKELWIAHNYTRP